MKKIYLFLLSLSTIPFIQPALAQLLQIDNNHSLSGFPFNGKLLFSSDRDYLLYVSNGSSTATVLTNAVTTPDSEFGLFNNKLYFSGLTAANGKELWVTDATAGGTVLVNDLVPGPTGSDPMDFASLNNKIYFTATNAATGRELYEYSGSGNPTRITDLNPAGASSFNDPHYYYLNGLFYFDAINASGHALYTLLGSTITKIFDIPVGYQMGEFSKLGSTGFFSITSGSLGMSLYKTNGTAGGTILLHHFGSTLFTSFIPVEFNNQLIFSACESAFDVELWKTDGTTTQLIKDINAGLMPSYPFVINSVILNGKLFFTASTEEDGAELWTTDGTTGGTTQFMNINTNAGEGSNPILMPVFSIDYSNINDFDYYRRDRTYNGFVFLIADNGATGAELWKTNGTVAGTTLVKDINPTGDGPDGTYMYTTSGLLFSGDNGIDGMEPWISNGLSSGTVPIVNINPLGDSYPSFDFIWNGYVYLTATNGDDPSFDDYFRLDGPYVSLPIQLKSFTATAANPLVHLDWSTASESNSKLFEVMRSVDGSNYSTIGKVNAAGNSSAIKKYSFDDKNAFELGVLKLFYKLKTEDNDGKFEYSDIERVSLEITNGWIRLYPNPVAGQLQIMYSAPNGNGELRIMGANGLQLYKLVLPKTERGTHKVDVSGLRPGTYIVLYINGSKVSTRKFIKK